MHFPVSYTHLDVYKRQSPMGSPAALKAEGSNPAAAKGNEAGKKSLLFMNAEGIINKTISES